jgi:hypothetical protein
MNADEVVADKMQSDSLLVVFNLFLKTSTKHEIIWTFFSVLNLFTPTNRLGAVKQFNPQEILRLCRRTPEV